MQLHLFNPENDLALADGNANYCAPPSALKIAYDLASLPLWYADEDSCVFLPDIQHSEYHKFYSQYFSFPSKFNAENLGNISRCTPWGWSLHVRKRFQNTGFLSDSLISTQSIAKLRELSNRKITIEILRLKTAAAKLNLRTQPHFKTAHISRRKIICNN